MSRLISTPEREICKFNGYFTPTSDEEELEIIDPPYNTQISFMKEASDIQKNYLQESLTDTEAALFVMSTTIGIGIIYLPPNFYNLGIPLGIIMTISMGVLNYYSSHLYFQTLKNLPGRVE